MALNGKLYDIGSVDYHRNLDDSGGTVKNVAGDTPEQTGSNTAASVGDDDPSTHWQVGSVDADDTRIIRRFEKPRPVRYLHGRGDFSASSAVRVVAGAKGSPAERYAVRDEPNGSIQSPNFQNTASYTVEVILARRGSIDLAVSDFYYPAWRGTGFGSLSTREWVLTVGRTGYGFNVARFSGTDTGLWNTGVDLFDGRLHSHILTVDDSTGTATMFLDGVQVDQETGLPAYSSQTDKVQIFQGETRFDCAKVVVWGYAMTPEQVAKRWDAHTEGSVDDLELLWRFTDGSGNVTDDSGNGRDGTVSACSWVSLVNTSSRVSEVTSFSPAGPWSERRAIRRSPTSGASAVSNTSIDLAPTVCLAGWLSVDDGYKATANKLMCHVGVNWATKDFGLFYGWNNDKLNLEVTRVAGPAAFAVSQDPVNDGVPRFVRIVIDGLDLRAYLYLDEVLQSSVAIPAFSTASNAVLSLAKDVPGYTFGDWVIWTHKPTAAEIEAARSGRVVPSEEVAHLWRIGDEESTTTVTDYGGGAYGSGTSDLNITNVDFETIGAVYDTERVPVAGYRGRFNIDLGSAVDMAEILWLFFDPENAEGDLRVDTLGAYGVTSVTIMPSTSTLDLEGFTVDTSPSGWPILPIYPPRRRHRVVLPHLSVDEIAEIDALVRSKRVCLIPALSDESSVYGDLELVRGQIIESGQCRQQATLRLYPGAREILVLELP